MNFMKNISRADCGFLDRMPKDEREALNAQITAEQEYRRGLLDVGQLAECLNLSRDGVLSLPLNFVTPYRPTLRGLRQVKCNHIDDLRAFLAGLNFAFADYDPAEGSLLRAAQAIGLMTDHGMDISGGELANMRRRSEGPECIQLNQRAIRYRRNNVLDWIKNPLGKPLTASELIMEH